MDILKTVTISTVTIATGHQVRPLNMLSFIVQNEKVKEAQENFSRLLGAE